MIDQQIIDAILALNEAAEALRVDFFMIGRLARDVRLGGRVPENRLAATADIDFVFLVRDWDHYAVLQRTLVDRPTHDFRRDPKRRQRLIFRSSLAVDIVPAGGVADAHGRAGWPPDGTPAMNVQGFEDALKDAAGVALGGIQVRVASVPGLALLKLLAWADDPSRNKDIQDLALFMKHYEKLTDEARLWSGGDSDLSEADDFDFSQAWSRILGRDVGRMIRSPGTVECLLRILRRERAEPYDLVTLLVRFLVPDFDRAQAIFNAFCIGVTEGLERQA